jgi:hypothetical protein
MEFKPDYECKYCRKKESVHAVVEDAGVGAGGMHRFTLSDFNIGYKQADELWRQKNKPVRAV